MRAMEKERKDYKLIDDLGKIYIHVSFLRRDFPCMQIRREEVRCATEK